MKTPTPQSLLRWSAAFGFAMMGTSCVVPYDADPTVTSHTVTTYQPGYVTSTLPVGYETEVVGGVSYYRHGGTYYRPARSGYVVVESPRREVVITRLPSGYRTIRHAGTVYYRAGNTYYRPSGGGYVMVEAPF